jgi:cationic peptide transport system permease protein
MIIYILKKIFTYLFILLLLSQLSFAVVYFSSGIIYHQYSFFYAYTGYFSDLLSGQLPISNYGTVSLGAIIKQVLPPTIELCLFAVLLSSITGIILGIIAGLKPDHWPNKFIQAGSLIISACPMVWLAVLMMSLFTSNRYLFPDYGSLIEQINPRTGFPIIDIFLTPSLNRTQEIIKELQYLALPGIILSIHPCIITIQLVSQQVVKVAKQKYIQAISIREQSQLKILVRHMLPNVFPPIIPRLTYNLTIILYSAIIIEIIFKRTGLGTWVMQGFVDKDSLVIAIAMMICGLLLCSLNLFIMLITIMIQPLRHQELYDE